MVWPAPGDGGAAAGRGTLSAGGSIDLEGIWAPFRLMDTGTIYGRTRDGFAVVAHARSARTVSFDVKSHAVLDPFLLR